MSNQRDTISVPFITRLQPRPRLYLPAVHGHVRLWRVSNDTRPGRDREIQLLASRPNQIQFSWGHVAAMCIGRGNRDYRVSAMYVEFENLADPGLTVVAPTFERGAGIEYYGDLAYSDSKDFLRVPLIQEPMLGIEPGYEDYFTEGVSGNRLTFFAITQGTQGVHGKTFSDLANSKVYGAALVATPVYGDPSQDVIFARTYFDDADQTPKEASAQVGITWDIVFE